MTIPEALQIAVRRHQAGQLAEAEALYRQILAAQPGHAEALRLLGAVAQQQGRYDFARECFRQSIDLDSKYPAAHCLLGESFLALDRFDEAVAAFRRALEIKPNFPEAHNNLGNALWKQGQGEEASAAFCQALRLKPDFPAAQTNLGNVLLDQGVIDEAIAAFRRALTLQPDFPEAHNNLGNALTERGQMNEAVASFHRALKLQPDYAKAYSNLGNALKELGRVDEAIAALRRAIELHPDSPEANGNLGGALISQGRLDEAIAAYRRAIELEPKLDWAHSGLIYTLHFHPDHDRRTISEEQRRWNRQFSDPWKQLIGPHMNNRDPERPLRVGYVSADFREHSAGRFALPLIECHDRERVEILCYSGVAHSDWMTARFRELAGKWRDTAGVPDARLADIIREDEVDILVDLAMHTAGNRLPLFARQPAPVQVTWLGYPGGTGLDGIGYRLTDARMDPPGETLNDFGEEPARLTDCWCCYQPPVNCPEVGPLPMLAAEGVTFGSLNNFAKMNQRVLALWARILDAMKGSRLLMFCPEGQARERVRAFFEARGVDRERLEMAGYMSPREHLSLYHRIDIGLDPIPFNGMTTTCDALWMGVPVVTLPGEAPISRAGLSLLSCIGLMELAASSEEDYLRIAVELAGNPARLAELRATLRQRMLFSPLMDAPRFARNVEAAYREMWKTWRAGSAPAREAK